MTAPDVMAATRWADNAAMIADLARLGWLRKDWPTLDPTYGEGNWWTRWRPDRLTCHDLYKFDGVDFRDLPEPDAWFRAIVYDPPYVCMGGRDSSGIPDFLDRYGLHGAPTSPAALQRLIDDGLAEMRRVVTPDGWVHMKCTDYVSSGRLWLGVSRSIAAAERVGFRVHDILEHVGDARAQPAGRVGAGGQLVRQQHARRNLSTLLVLRPTRRRPKKS